MKNKVLSLSLLSILSLSCYAYNIEPEIKKNPQGGLESITATFTMSKEQLDTWTNHPEIKKIIDTYKQLDYAVKAKDLARVINCGRQFLENSFLADLLNNLIKAFFKTAIRYNLIQEQDNDLFAQQDKKTLKMLSAMCIMQGNIDDCQEIKKQLKIIIAKMHDYTIKKTKQHVQSPDNA